MQSLLYLIILLLVLACSSPPPPDSSDPGQLLFYGYARPEVVCYECHGVGGRGSWQAPAIHRVFAEHDSAYVSRIIMQGKGGEDEMPAFQDKLSKTELAALVTFIGKLEYAE